MWERTKKDAKAKHDLLTGKSDKEQKNVGSLIGGYESSDEDEGDDVDDVARPSTSPPPPPPPPDVEFPPLPDEIDSRPTGRAPTGSDGHGDHKLAEGDMPAGEDEERQRLRRLKAEEWKRERAETKTRLDPAQHLHLDYAVLRHVLL